MYSVVQRLDPLEVQRNEELLRRVREAEEETRRGEHPIIAHNT